MPNTTQLFHNASANAETEESLTESVSPNGSTQRQVDLTNSSNSSENEIVESNRNEIYEDSSSAEMSASSNGSVAGLSSEDRGVFAAKIISTLDAYRNMLEETNNNKEHSLIVAGVLGVSSEKADSEVDIVLAILDADVKNYLMLKALIEARKLKEVDQVFYLLECREETLSDMVSMLSNVSGQEHASGMTTVEKVKFVQPLIVNLPEEQVKFLYDACRLLEASQVEK